MPASMTELTEAASVIPILTVSNVEDAVPLASALRAGGLHVIELTLRTEATLMALTKMKDAEPDLLIGVGTIRNAQQIDMAESAGADFLVSPGLTRELEHAFPKARVPILPGVATASEAMQAAALGFDVLKFFPAEQAGGIDYLKSLQGPLPDIRFCPTGSITRTLAPDYLALPNVVCVGGSWIANSAMIEAGNWSAITANAESAAAMAE